MSNSRRDFIKKSAVVSSALVVGGALPGFSAESYKRIITELSLNRLVKDSIQINNIRSNLSLYHVFLLKNCRVS